MTRQKTFKRKVRTRMQNTGESYTTARRQLLAGYAPAEFERQVEHLVERAYPQRAGVGEAEFRGLLAPLAERAPESAFAIVISAELVAPLEAVAALELRGKPGFTDMSGEELARFAAIDGVEVPAAAAYLITDIDTGVETLNVTPDAALPMITDAGRSPLTLAEGLAIATHYPDWLYERNCFSLLGSRCGDKRVTALWVKRGGNPRLGWCWAGNPHTWLGSASCGARIGVSG